MHSGHTGRAAVGICLLLAVVGSLPCALAFDGYHYVTSWSGYGSGDGQFFLPNRMAVGPNGTLHIVDAGNHRIKRLRPDGTWLTPFGSLGTGEGQFQFPHGIAVDAQGYVYVGDHYLAKVQVFRSDGTYVRCWGSRGTGPGQFGDGMPGLAVDSQGYVYVCDQSNYRVQKLTRDGMPVASFGSFGAFVFDVAVDENDFVYTVERGYGGSTSRVQKFTSAGTVIMSWGSKGVINGSFWGCNGIATDRHGHVFVVHQPTPSMGAAVEVFTTAGQFLGWLGSGNLTTGWHSATNTEYMLPGMFGSLNDVAADLCGNLYTTEGNDPGTTVQKVQKFEPIGTQLTNWIAGTVMLEGQTDHSGVTVTADPGNHTATTVEDGSYFLPMLSPATYTVTAAKSGWQLSPSSQTVTAPASDVNFTGSQGAVIHVHVTDALGMDISGAKVSCAVNGLDDISQWPSVATTDSQGRCDVPLTAQQMAAGTVFSASHMAGGYLTSELVEPTSGAVSLVLNRHRAAGRTYTTGAWVVAHGDTTPIADGYPEALGSGGKPDPKFDTLSPMWLKDDGTLRDGDLAAVSMLSGAHSSRIAVVPVHVGGDGSAGLKDRIALATGRQSLAATFTRTATANGLDGVDLDFEEFTQAGWIPQDFRNYEQFLALLCTMMHERGKVVSLTWQPRYLSESLDESLDWHAVLGGDGGRFVDELRIMAYDYDRPSDQYSPAPKSTCRAQDLGNLLGSIHEVLPSHVSKVVIALPLYSRTWLPVTPGGQWRTALSSENGGRDGNFFDTALGQLRQIRYSQRIRRDHAQGDVPSYCRVYDEQGHKWDEAAEQAWFEDASSLSYKMRLVCAFAPKLRGVFFWHVPETDPALLEVLGNLAGTGPSALWPAMPRSPWAMDLLGRTLLHWGSPQPAMDAEIYRKAAGHFLPRGSESMMNVQTLATTSRTTYVLPGAPGIYAVASVTPAGLRGGWVEAVDWPLAVVSHSPVDLTVQFPDGSSYQAADADDEHVGFVSDDLDGDGETEDILTFDTAPDGEYVVHVTPKNGADPADVYGLEVYLRGERIVLTRSTLVANIPAGGYRFRISGDEIEDLVPPTFTLCTPDPKILWPANDKLQSVALNYTVSDNADPDPEVQLSVTCNETGFDPAVDVGIVDNHTVKLRAKRDGRTADGRIYTITLTARDDAGNQATCQTTVTVPHDQRVKGAQVTTAVAMQTDLGAQIVVTLGADASLSAEVMNMAGRVVRRVCVDKAAPAGVSTLLWDGRSDRGTRVPGGRYLVRLTARTADGNQSQVVVPLMMKR